MKEKLELHSHNGEGREVDRCVVRKGEKDVATCSAGL